jgi:hypothetical protein
MDWISSAELLTWTGRMHASTCRYDMMQAGRSKNLVLQRTYSFADHCQQHYSLDNTFMKPLEDKLGQSRQTFQTPVAGLTHKIESDPQSLTVLELYPRTRGGCRTRFWMADVLARVTAAQLLTRRTRRPEVVDGWRRGRRQLKSNPRNNASLTVGLATRVT